MFRSGGAPVPKQHNSFANRQQPVLQQIAAKSKFNGAAKPDIESASVQSTPRETAKLKSKNKSTNQTLYPTTDIFFNKDENEEADFYNFEEQPQQATLDTTLLGGQDTDDRWTTTQMQGDAGQPTHIPGKKQGVKISSGTKGTFLWGDVPAHDYSKKPVETEPEEDFDEPVEPEVLTKLKKALTSRGAKGLLGIGKRFKIMDVSCQLYFVYCAVSYIVYYISVSVILD